MNNDFILTKPFESKSYAEFASKCNLAGRVIENRDDYLEGIVMAEPLDSLKAKKWADIQMACATYRETATCKVGEMYFSISEQAKINLTSVVLMGQVIGSVQYFEKSGIKHTFTIAEFMPIATAIGQGIAATESKYYQFENAIKNATTKEQLDLIQWGDA